MLESLHQNRPLQLLLGLGFGMAFGALLHMGGLTRYDVLMGQLLLHDWTVAKVILTAVLTGMIGVHLLQARGLVQISVYPGSVGGTVLGGLIFGAGFGLLGYCPGTLAGAVGSGSLHGLAGGVPGMILGAMVYAHNRESLQPLEQKGSFPRETLPALLGIARLPALIVAAAVLLCTLLLLGAFTG